MRKLLLLLCFPLLTLGQDSTSTNRFRTVHTVFAGLKIPLNCTAGYRRQFHRRVSAQAEGGLIAASFDRYTLKTLETFGLDPTLSGALDRSFRVGSSLSVGVNVHANTPWYVGAFGQYVQLAAGPITPADALGVYFGRDFSSVGLLNSPSFVFNLQANLWVAGVRAGRSFRFAPSRFGLIIEASLGKTWALGTRLTRTSLWWTD